MQNIVRLTALEIHNMKNVIYGKLDFAQGRRGSILGIYGENGSGKTVVVDCMVLLKCLLSGRSVPSQLYAYINSQSAAANVKYCFEVQSGSLKMYVEYEIGLLKNGETRFCIQMEKLSAKQVEKGKRTKLTPIFEYQRGEKQLFRPLKYYSYFEKDLDSLVTLGIARKSSENYNEEKQRAEVTSFLFSKNAQEVFSREKSEAGKIYELSSIMQLYGLRDLTVIENSHYGLLTLNVDTLPVNIEWPEFMKPYAMGIMLHLTDINVIPKEVYPYIANTIDLINIVLEKLVPGVQIEIYNSFDKLMENGKDGIQFEIISIRGTARVPLLYESAGIKKLISICSSLVACYNRESYCLVIDELDSGIYEYLLGECLEAMQEKAKGQLIFTSHNLRPLEVLENDFLIYTTINPENRYIKSSYIKNTQNKRLSYLRSIKLGGQKEKLYHDTNIYEIGLAMRKAGRAGVYD